jgi:alpha-glucosidase
LDKLDIVGERTQFSFPVGAIGQALPLNSFRTSYERRYVPRSVAALPADWLLGLPYLVEVPGVGWAAVTEANLTDYAGLYLARDGSPGKSLVSRLSPLPKDDKIAVRRRLPCETPWRVILLTDYPVVRLAIEMPGGQVIDPANAAAFGVTFKVSGTTETPTIRLFWSALRY